MDKLTCYPIFLVFFELTNTCPWDILSPSMHYNDKIREKATTLVQDHILAAEELKTVWLFVLHPRHQSCSRDCLRITPLPCDLDHNWITRGKRQL